MLCACSGEQFKVEEPISRSPESLATRDFSASCLSSRTGTGDWDSKFEDAQVDEAESTLKEALSLNYEEARALLGRLEYQKGNFDAALQVFYGIDIKSLSPRMVKAISDRTLLYNSKSKRENSVVGLMSLHSVSLLIEAILLKAKSLQEMSRFKEAAKECKMILDIVESALPNGMPDAMAENCKLQEMFHKALELLPKLWIEAGILSEAIVAYRRALNIDSQTIERELEIEAWLDLANIYTKLQSLSDAEICVSKARSKEFYYPRAWHSTGLLLEAQSLHNEALIAFSVSLSIEPDYVPSIISTAKTLMKMGGTETLPIARSFLMNSLRLEPTNHDAWFNLGLICKKEGLVLQAADFFQAAHELESSAPVQSFVS
ncbi:hypothetical protein L1987_44528 [Smallanthus sonchifolius]|uniref:Uncharacterized protein n=1 Tax=Smallanthus sonchifolius TaxID=185202 RepID=A0ACB9GQP9_9ASTR|nr:hypothetical protein L1987_44528 [Smallanthus sonchifolius]